MNPSSFANSLAEIALKNVFNPYANICSIYDKEDAAVIRCQNLSSYLAAAQALGVDTIWMGRDLGYRGGRRTGLAFTDEYHLLKVPKLFPGALLSKATHGTAVSERTAAEIWTALPMAPRPPLFWNVFPFHPHECGNPLTNRRFTRKELAEVDDLNAWLITCLDIKSIISIGQDAAQYANRFGISVRVIRHPSYGGAIDFRRGIASVYGYQGSFHGKSDGQRSLFAR